MGAVPAVGVDLGGTNVRAAVVSPEGKILAAARARVAEDRSVEGVVARTAQIVDQVLRESGLSLGEAAGVGIGVAGQLRQDSGVVASGPNLGWREVPFGALMAAALGRKVKVVNDVEAITWGEVSFGAARGFRDVLVVFAGTGIGGGLVVDGRPYRGATRVAAEIGHVKVQPGGAECGCGQLGCLEAYCGGGNLSRRLRQEAQTDWPALLAKAGGDPGRIHPGLVEDLVREGEGRAMALWDQLSHWFGLALANAVTILNPAALVLGGKVLVGSPTLARLTEKVLRQQVLAVSGEALRVLPPGLGDDGGIIGAASLSTAAF